MLFGAVLAWVITKVIIIHPHLLRQSSIACLNALKGVNYIQSWYNSDTVDAGRIVVGKLESCEILSVLSRYVASATFLSINLSIIHIGLVMFT